MGNQHASASIRLEEFEQIEAEPGSALLRVSAKPTSEASSDVSPTLLIDNGARVYRLSPLPAPPGSGETLRAAYSAPAALLRGRTAFALELPDGELIQLPAPARSDRSVAANRAPAPPRDPGGTNSRRDRQLPDEAERRVAARLDASVELDANLRAEQNRRAQAERQAAEAAEAATHSISRLEKALSERDAENDLLRSELDSRLAAGKQARQRMAELQQQSAEGERRLQELRGEVTEVTSRLAALEQLVQSSDIQTVPSGTALLDTQVEAAHYRERAETLEQLRAEHDRSIADLKSDLTAARTRAEEQAERSTSLEGLAGDLHTELRQTRQVARRTEERAHSYQHQT